MAAVLGVLAGYSANQAAKREASALEAEGLRLRDEAYAEAQRRATEVRKFKAKQKLAFLSNGVNITGTPQLVLEETKTQGQSEVNALANRGNAFANLAYKRAGIMRYEGRSAFIGSIFSGIGQVASQSMNQQSGYGTQGLGGV